MAANEKIEIQLEVGHHARRREHCKNGRTHDFRVWVKGQQGKNISLFVDKVEFQLHPTFNDPLRILTEPPYEIKDSAYGTSPIEIRIFFSNKMVTFSYDVVLMMDRDIKAQTTKSLTVRNPQPEKFRQLLLQAGGILHKLDSPNPNGSNLNCGNESSIVSAANEENHLANSSVNMNILKQSPSQLAKYSTIATNKSRENLNDLHVLSEDHDAISTEQLAYSNKRSKKERHHKESGASSKEVKHKKRKRDKDRDRDPNILESALFSQPCTFEQRVLSSPKREKLLLKVKSPLKRPCTVEESAVLLPESFIMGQRVIPAKQISTTKLKEKSTPSQHLFDDSLSDSLSTDSDEKSNLQKNNFFFSSTQSTPSKKESRSKSITNSFDAPPSFISNRGESDTSKMMTAAPAARDNVLPDFFAASKRVRDDLRQQSQPLESNIFSLEESKRSYSNVNTTTSSSSITSTTCTTGNSATSICKDTKIGNNANASAADKSVSKKFAETSKDTKVKENLTLNKSGGATADSSNSEKLKIMKMKPTHRSDAAFNVKKSKLDESVSFTKEKEHKKRKKERKEKKKKKEKNKEREREREKIRDSEDVKKKSTFNIKDEFKPNTSSYSIINDLEPQSKSKLHINRLDIQHQLFGSDDDNEDEEQSNAHLSSINCTPAFLDYEFICRSPSPAPVVTSAPQPTCFSAASLNQESVKMVDKSQIENHDAASLTHSLPSHLSLSPESSRLAPYDSESNAKNFSRSPLQLISQVSNESFGFGQIPFTCSDALSSHSSSASTDGSSITLRLENTSLVSHQRQVHLNPFQQSYDTPLDTDLDEEIVQLANKLENVHDLVILRSLADVLFSAQSGAEKLDGRLQFDLAELDSRTLQRIKIVLFTPPS